MARGQARSNGDACVLVNHTKFLGLQRLESGRFWPERASEHACLFRELAGIRFLSVYYYLTHLATSISVQRYPLTSTTHQCIYVPILTNLIRPMTAD